MISVTCSRPHELCMNIRRLADRGPQTSGQRKYRQGNRRNCMNMVSGKSGKIPRGLSMWSRNHTFLLGSENGAFSNWTLEKIWIKWQLCTHTQSEKFWIGKAGLLGGLCDIKAVTSLWPEYALHGIWDLGFIIICATSAGCKRIEIYSTGLTLTSPQMLLS